MTREEARRRARQPGVDIADRVHAATVVGADQNGVWVTEGWRSVSRITRVDRGSGRGRATAPSYRMVNDGVDIAVDRGLLHEESTPDRIILAGFGDEK